MDRRRQRKPPAQPLVLIVDAHEDTRKMYVSALSALGFEAIAAENEADAYERAFRFHPDIVMVHLPMSDSEGWEFLQPLKRIPRTRDIPVVAISDRVQRTMRERAERDGFAAFFPKPCSPERLADGLRRVLEGQAYVPRDDDTLKRCPQCQRNTLLLIRHYPVLADTTTLARTGTDAHDGRDRLYYQRAWVCQNPPCKYRGTAGE